MSKPSASRRWSGVATLTLLAGLVVGGWLVPGTAGAARTTPQLSIAVDNQQDATAPGASMVYTVTITNLGQKAVKNLLVSQTVPAGAVLRRVDGQGKVKAGNVQWKLDLPAAKAATFHTTMTVAKATPDELLRLATVACATTSAKAAALVCASDSDQLPAGAKAEAAQRSAADPATTRLRWWYAVGSAALVGAALVAVLLTLRIRNLRLRRRDASG